MDKFIISRQKFEGENKVSTDYVALDSNNNIVASTDPLAFDGYFGSKEQAVAFKESYKKHLAATETADGVTYKVRVKTATQAVRDYCTQSMAVLEQKATVTEETQATVLEAIKVEEPEQPAEATVETPKAEKPAKAKKADKAKKAAKKAEQAAA